MTPAVGLLAILLAATPLIALAVHYPMLPLVALGVMGSAVIAALLDGAISRSRDMVSVERTVAKILSLGAPEEVRLTLVNRTGRTLRLLVKDEPPQGFAAPERTRRVTLGAHERRTVSYRIISHERGDHEFGSINLRGLSRLKLAWWQRRIEVAETVSVYPNLRQITEFDAKARRGRLEEIGLRTARPRGEGTEFESLREYVPDDSYRSIDWKATARRGEPITRQYQTERNQTVMLLIDGGRMMGARTGKLARIDYAINTALMLAHVATRMGDTVGLLAFSDRIRSFIAPSHATGQTERILRELYDLQAEMVEPDFRSAIGFLRTRARKRALVCAFTDLVDPDVSAAALTYLSSLRPRHLPMVVTVRDPGIEELAAEVPEVVEEAYEKALAQRTLEERALALARLRSRGAVVCDAAPDELTARVISQYLSVKRSGML